MLRQLISTTALRHVWLWSCLIGIYALLAVAKEESVFAQFGDVPAIMEGIVTFAMGILLVVRINRCYERWWEARTLWGTLVNACRNLAVKFREFAEPDQHGRAEFRDLIVVFCHVLREHLQRRGAAGAPPSSPTDAKVNHGPSLVSGRIYAALKSASRVGQVTQEELWMLDREARILLEVCGGCERIKNTLMPQSFRIFVRHGLLVYLLLLPWGLVEDFRYWTIPVSMITTYLVISAETISRFIEEPFGHTEDHLDLDTICAAIESSVSEILECRDNEVPAPKQRS